MTNELWVNVILFGRSDDVLLPSVVFTAVEIKANTHKHSCLHIHEFVKLMMHIECVYTNTEQSKKGVICMESHVVIDNFSG